MAIYTLMQFYDPPMRCFTFQDYQLALTMKEYSYIMRVEIKDQVPFINTKELPEFHHIAEALHLEKKDVKLNLKLKGGIHGFTLKFLMDKATTFVDAGSCNTSNVIFGLLINVIMLFPNNEDFVDLDSICIFMYGNLVPTLLVDTYYSIHLRNHKKKGNIVCCAHLLYKLCMSHLPNKGHFIENRGNLKWSQRIMPLTTEDILWYFQNYDDFKIILNYGSFPNMPLIGTKVGIKYNPSLSLR
ncbi:uncharacterized protein LOC127130107 [Lathyrus oleraceus]|uniref:uncharacterized protein LOC127130107 n=1 Tax=Pisum sativum TaxID=3888 RepID=UPI0021D2461F|nr:uncharacterized protein LOC127130107 [Pisum sativum]